MSKEKWDDSSIQFPRLLAEINAVGLTVDQIQGLAESMDLHTDEINNIFERANSRWEVSKAVTLGDQVIHVNCPSCDHGVLKRTDMEERYEVGTECLNCGREVIIDEQGYVS